MPCYQFGPFLLDSDRRMLLRNEEQLAISAKTFDTLLTLVESPGRVVLKEELLDRVWAGARTEEGSLTQSVFTVRKLLGDSAKEAHYIATIAGRGYQFVSPVSKIDTNKPANVASPFIQQAITWRIGGVAGLICAGFAMYYFGASRELPPVTNYTQITHDGVEKSLVGIGGNALFFEKGSDTVRLDLESGVEQTIRVAGKGTINVNPNGKDLLWQTPFSAPVVESQLWRMPISGQSPQALSHSLGHDGTWSRNGKQLIYAHGTKLYLADLNGEHPNQIADLPGIARHLSWSPDERLVRFDLLNPNSVSRTLWQIEMGEHKVRSLLDLKVFADACCGKWTADGAYFVFESAGQLWTLNEKHPGNIPVQLTFSPMRLSTPIPGPKSQQIFAIGKVLRGELLQYDPAGQKWVSFLNGVSAEFVDVSPDEKWVTYVSFPQGVLWRSKSDGTERLALSPVPLHAFGPKWSRDGKQIVFSDRGTGRPSKLYTVDTYGHALHELLSEDNESQVDCDWTPDGKKIVFGNDFTAAKPAIHILNLETKATETVPGSLGLFSPRISPNGRYLAALPLDLRKLMIYDFQTQHWKILAEGDFTFPAWSSDSTSVYAGDSYHGKFAIVRIRLENQSKAPLLYGYDFASTGSIGFWFGLGPGQSILALRDTGIKDIFSLTWPRQ